MVEIAAALPEGVTLDELTPEERARAEEMVREMAEARRRLLETPASMIVATSCSTPTSLVRSRHSTT